MPMIKQVPNSRTPQRTPKQPTTIPDNLGQFETNWDKFGQKLDCIHRTNATLTHNRTYAETNDTDHGQIGTNWDKLG